MTRILSFFLFTLMLFVTACGDALQYKAGGFGTHLGGAGSGSSVVTISGYVMSSTTAQSVSSQLSGLESNKSSFASAFSAMTSSFETDASALSSVVQNSSDACSSAAWSMTYVGEGSTVVRSGISSGDGSFTVPTVPSGKEGLVTFNCTGGTQKCLVKAGDSGVTCNAIADGVVGAIEASLGKSLTSNDLQGKTVAKMASTIVEASKTDSADTQSFKNAITNCKGLPQTSIAEIQAKQACYKNSLEASSLSGTLEVIKTLAQQWTVRSLFNFVVVNAGYKIYMDNMIYTPFGSAMDNWFSTDFIDETRNYMADLISNPDYIGGNVNNGEQLVKVHCEMWYYKYGTNGKTSYKPALTTVGAITNVPDCYNLTAIEAFTGALTVAQKNALTTAIADNDYIGIQIGVPGDENGNGVIDGGESYVDFDADGDANPGTGQATNCTSGASWDTPGNFCVYTPNMSLISKVREANRNDVSGIYYRDDLEYQPFVSIIETFGDVNSKVDEMDEISNDVISPNYNPALAGCLTMPSGGAPTINLADATCTNWAKTNFQSVKKDFGGLLGLYMYLKDPSSYSNGTSAKLSLVDIHRLFVKSDFLNTKLVAYGGDYNGKQGPNSRWYNPILDLSTGTARFQNIFDYSVPGPLAVGDVNTALANGSLLDAFDLTFAMFEEIPTSTQIQTYVQNASHHEEWNPYGEKYNYVAGIDRAGTIYPIYCRMLNRSKVDGSGNFVPMEKELNQSTKIECLQDPENNGVTDATGGLFNVPGTFSYPYALQQRGWNGDDKGKLFILVDRKTGQPIYVADKEIYILEGNANNTSMLVSGSCGAAVTDAGTLNSAAPLVKASVYYGSGDYARNEIVDAYCMNLSTYFENDNETRFYYGGEVNITENYNGEIYSYSQPLVGGRLTTSSSLMNNPVCLFVNSAYFDFDQVTGKYSVNSSYLTGLVTSLHTDAYNTIITTLSTSGVNVDFCDSSSYGSDIKYYLSHFFENVSYDATNGTPPFRAAKPAGIVRASDETSLNGLIVSLGAIEAKLANLTVANTTATAWAHDLKMINQKHNAKFDPYCDDLNNNGGCDCYIGNSATLRSNWEECTLGDTAAEPTISSAPYPIYGSNGDDYKTFFDNYGNLSGTALNDGGTPLDDSYFWTNNLYMNYEDVFTCAYLKTGETSRRRPTYLVWDDFSSEHFEGCPDNTGVINAVGYTGPTPTSGGGPVRIIKPKPMNNAYDIAYPKTMLNMMNYATKTVGQGVTIDPNAKVFSFDEALALVNVRFLIPPQGMDVEDPTGTYVYENAAPFFDAVYNPANDQEISAISAVLKGITKPSELSNGTP